MRIKRFHVLALLLAASLLLAACGGAQQTLAFPGLVTDGELVYLAQGQFVRAIDVPAQAQRWSFPTAAIPAFGLFVSTPAVDDEWVIVGSEGPAGSYSGAVFGLERATGVQRWCLVFDQKGADRLAAYNCQRAQGKEAAKLFGLFSGAVDNRVIGGIAIDDGQAYFGLANGTVYAVDAATGQQIWHYPGAERDIWSTPIVSDDMVYVTSLDHNVYALDRANGEEVWSKDMGATVAGTPTLVEDRLYVGTFGNALYALDAASGEDAWPAYQTSNWVWDGPAVQDGTLYFVDVGGTVYAVDAATGQKAWDPQKPGAAMRASPAVTPERLFSGDRSGNLFALNPANGALAWQNPVKVDGEILATPVIVGDYVVVAPYQGDNALESYTLDGNLYWPFKPGN